MARPSRDLRHITPQRVRREPEHGALYQVLREHLADFVERAGADPDRPGLPRFVVRELRAYLDCGIPARGFARLRCPDCRHETVVAFSCKGRGFCPSCGGRRMAARAADLVDHVLPDVPYRQWVLTLPYRLRYLLAYDAAACGAVLDAFLRELFAWQRRRARRAGLKGAACGSVTAIQRFGSMLNLNVHYHVLVPDGVFAPDADGVRFHALDAPTQADVTQLVRQVRDRILRRLARLGHGLWSDDEGDDVPDALAVDDPLLASCYAASVQGRVALGERAGRRVERDGFDHGAPWDDGHPPLCAAADAFNLHANVTVRAGDREGLEHLCRYLVRPPFAADSLARLSDGRVALELRRPLRDGSTHLFFTPHELIEKLCALIPRPRMHMLRYHGLC